MCCFVFDAGVGFKKTEEVMIKTMLALMLISTMTPAQAFGGPSGDYQCKVDNRGVVVCYPKPRGF